MRLAQRVFALSLAIIGVLVIVLVVLADRRLHDRLVSDTIENLTHEGQFVATLWRPGVDANALAHNAGGLLHRRITLIDPQGRVIGDTDFEPPALQQLPNHGNREEVIEALKTGVGTSRRESPAAGDEELYVAVRAPLGVARLSVSTRDLEDIIGGAEQDVAKAAFIALIVALVLTLVFARGVTRPIIELRDVAQALAAGNLDRRPQLAAPGEIGDLAEALSRMAEQLGTRLGALQAHDTLMTTLIESLSEGVLAVSGAGDVVRVNASAASLLGLRNPPPFPAAMLPRDRALREALDNALRGMPQPPAEASINGRTLAITARPLAERGAVLTLFDLTPLRKLEVVRRDFVANVSHELRTPLTAIQGYAETLAERDLAPADHEQFVRTIRSNAERMQRLVDDLLDLSRIESGGWRPQPTHVQLQAAIAEGTAAARAAAAQKGLEVDIRIAPDATQLFADPTAVRQVLTNVVENAVRYTSQGRVTIRSERGTGGVVIAVSDTGIGIPAEHLPRVFERFYRVDPSRSRELGGTGLGLAIVKHLVEAHGGWVTAESAPGRGTTVSVFFPDA